MDKIITSFHGLLEPLRATKISMPTLLIELIEVVVLVIVVYVIFFKFKNAKSPNSFSKGEEEK